MCWVATIIQIWTAAHSITDQMQKSTFMSISYIDLGESMPYLFNLNALFMLIGDLVFNKQRNQSHLHEPQNTETTTMIANKLTINDRY
jgi:hypothetical protein